VDCDERMMRWAIRGSKYYWWEQISLIKINVRPIK
jgi:hypothetical protein